MKKQKHLDETFLTLLFNGGVDSWEWYEESLQDVDMGNDSDIINALISGGVENWEWYSESLGQFSKYEEYVNDFPNDDFFNYYDWMSNIFNKESTKENSDSSAENNVKTVNKELSDADKIVIKYINDNYPDSNTDGIAEKVLSVIWKRSTFPKEFDRAIKKAQKENSKDLLHNASINLFKIVVKNGKLDKLIKSYI